MAEWKLISSWFSFLILFIAGMGYGGTGGRRVGPSGAVGAGGGVSSGSDPVSAHLGALAGLTTSSGGSSDDESVDGHLGLGELAQLTVNNEAEVSYDVSVLRLSFFLSVFFFLKLPSTFTRSPSTRNRSGRRGMPSIRCGATLTVSGRWPSILSSPFWSRPARIAHSSCGTYRKPFRLKSTVASTIQGCSFLNHRFFFLFVYLQVSVVGRRAGVHVPRPRWSGSLSGHELHG